MAEEKRTQKNITVALSPEEFEDFDFLVDYFQEKSIANVTRSDVFKFLLSQMTETIKKDKLQDIKELLNNSQER